MDFLLELLIFAYASTAIIAVIGYWPTIRDLYRKKPSANVSSYIIWTLDTGIVFLYSLFVVTDLLFRIVSGFNFVCCVIILLMSTSIKKRKRTIKKIR
jgi:hypothetical protein